MNCQGLQRSFVALDTALGTPSVAKRALTFVIVLHSVLLAYGAFVHSPVTTEIAQVPAGIAIWQNGTFDLHRVNPPLVRQLAALPLMLLDPVTDWRAFRSSPASRPEFDLGADFVRLNGQRTRIIFFASRLICIPFSILGAIVCYLWAKAYYGNQAGFIAATLYCFDPNILGNASLVSSDIAAAATGLTAHYMFVRWLAKPTFIGSTILGGTAGFALLSKTTWIVFLVIWPILAIIRVLLLSSVRKKSLSPAKIAAFVFLIAASATAIVNIAYGFDGTFKRLGEFEFVSAWASGRSDSTQIADHVNRWSDSYISQLPVPLPEDFVQGIDSQLRDFETPLWSYLNGTWKRGGWYRFYFQGLILKTPVGFLLLMALAFVLCPRSRDLRLRVYETCALLMPPLSIVLFVTSQMAFNRHFRYILPALPFCVVWASSVFAPGIKFKHTGYLRAFAYVCVLQGCLSSVMTYPHSLSYFNELVGGPLTGHRYMVYSAYDWGQDYWYLAKWARTQSGSEKIYLDADSVYSPLALGVFPARCIDVNFDPENRNLLQDGLYAISATHLVNDNRRYDRFRDVTPSARVGYSIFVFRSSSD